MYIASILMAMKMNMTWVKRKKPKKFQNSDHLDHSDWEEGLRHYLSLSLSLSL